MTELLTAAQMRAIEQAAIDSGEVTGLELMERAGRGVVEAIFEEWPELAKNPVQWLPFPRRLQRKAVVLCGPGNNGGDGFVVARLLAMKGWAIELFLCGDPQRLPPDARTNFEVWESINRWQPFPDTSQRLSELYDPHPDLWIDAIFGAGLNRALPDQVTDMMHRVYYEQNWCRAPIVALDMPSGVSSDTGKSVQVFHLSADLTVSFHAKKVGHVEADGPMRCGKVVVMNIGL